MRNKFVGAVFLFVIFIMSIRVFVVYVPLGLDFLWQGLPDTAFDALAAYPYEDMDAASEEAPTGTDSLVSRAYSAFNELKSLVTTYMSPNSHYFMDLVVGKRLADRTMGLDMTASLTAGEIGQDVVAVWQDDYLGYIVHDADNTIFIESIVGFGKQMRKEGRNFLYFMVPSKRVNTIAYPDYSEELRMQLLQGLGEHGLDIIDLNETLAEKQTDIKELFFKTDHHWLPSAGIWADRLLCEFMNKNYGYCIDTSIFDPENYDTVILKDSFLGSQGQKVTTVYCEKEDFPVVIPKYNTNLEVFISEKNEKCTGGIQDTLFDYESLKEGISDAYGKYAYRFYGYGDQALITIHNNDVHDGSCIMIIKTSFADVMVPYLSAAAEDIYVLDLRYFNGNLRTFIDETNPDTVVIVAGVTGLDVFDFSNVIEG